MSELPAATGPWKRLSKQNKPKPGRSYLIKASYAGLNTFDVAYYNGTHKDGSHWWTLGNVEIDQSSIVAFAEIF